MCAKSLQSYPTLCDPMDNSPLGSSVHEILQTRILEWVANNNQRIPHSLALCKIQELCPAKNEEFGV